MITRHGPGREGFPWLECSTRAASYRRGNITMMTIPQPRGHDVTEPAYPDTLPFDEENGGHAACTFVANGIRQMQHVDRYDFEMLAEENTSENGTEFVYRVQGRVFRTIVTRDDV